MKNGPAIPTWAAGVGIGLFVIVLLVVGYRVAAGPGPLDPATLPKEQQTNPYMRSDYYKKFQGGHSTAPGAHP